MKKGLKIGHRAIWDEGLRMRKMTLRIRVGDQEPATGYKSRYNRVHTENLAVKLTEFSMTNLLYSTFSTTKNAENCKNQSFWDMFCWTTRRMF